MNTENVHCHCMRCVEKRMQKEFWLRPWERSHKSYALEHIKWGHSWRIIQPINVHTAIAPIRIRVLKGQGLKLWGRKISKYFEIQEELLKAVMIFLHFEGGNMLFDCNSSFRQRLSSWIFVQHYCKAAYNSTEDQFSCTNCSRQIQMEGVSV